VDRLTHATFRLILLYANFRVLSPFDCLFCISTPRIAADYQGGKKRKKRRRRGTKPNARDLSPELDRSSCSTRSLSRPAARSGGEEKKKRKGEGKGGKGGKTKTTNGKVLGGSAPRLSTTFLY